MRESEASKANPGHKHRKGRRDGDTAQGSPADEGTPVHVTELITEGVSVRSANWSSLARASKRPPAQGHCPLRVRSTPQPRQRL